MLLIFVSLLGTSLLYYIHHHHGMSHSENKQLSSLIHKKDLDKNLKSRSSKKPTKQKRKIIITTIDNSEPMNINETLLMNQNMNYLYLLNQNLKKYAEVKTSPIREGELGLFTKRNLKKGDHIIYITGIVKSYEEIDEYNSDNVESILNQISTLDNRFYIIPRKKDYWSFINHKDERYRNSEFVELYYEFKTRGHREISNIRAKRGSQVLVVRAIKTIEKGEEIFVDYGDDYDYEDAKFERFSK
eukprot:gene4126-7412_t